LLVETWYSGSLKDTPECLGTMSHNLAEAASGYQAGCIDLPLGIDHKL
jgi:hypothetical protein